MIYVSLKRPNDISEWLVLYKARLDVISFIVKAFTLEEAVSSALDLFHQKKLESSNYLKLDDEPSNKDIDEAIIKGSWSEVDSIAGFTIFVKDEESKSDDLVIDSWKYVPPTASYWNPNDGGHPGDPGEIDVEGAHWDGEPPLSGDELHLIVDTYYDEIYEAIEAYEIAMEPEY